MSNRLKVEVNGRIAASAIALAAIAFPIFWYQEYGPAPLNGKTVLVLVFYVLSISGIVAVALGKLGPKLTSTAVDLKVQKTLSTLASKALPILFVALVLWSCYSIWRVLHAI